MTEPTIAIVGAGPLGLATALALHRNGHTPLLLDARKEGEASRDARVLAISDGSRVLLEALGAWPAQQVTAITHIHISQRGAAGETTLTADDYQLPALGHVLPASALTQALQQRVQEAGITIKHESSVTRVTDADGLAQLQLADGSTLDTRLALLCEGAIGEDDEGILKCDYHQHALLARVKTATPHQGLAWERFTPDGPIALLPLGADYSLVWTLPPARIDALSALSDDMLREELQAAFGNRTRFTALSHRARYPLTMRVRRNPVAGRRVWLGNAAQTLHPVAGQGLNLALRDAWELAETLCDAPDPGDAALLARYAHRRLPDRAGALLFTDALVRVFSSANPLLTHLRGAGLLALDVLPPLRHFVAKRMLYGARAWP